MPDTPSRAKGVLNVVAVIVIGESLSWMYGRLAPLVTGDVRPGPPTYDFEIWLASALLSVTFPLLIFYAEFFQFWPLQGTGAARRSSGGLQACLSHQDALETSWLAGNNSRADFRNSHTSAEVSPRRHATCTSNSAWGSLSGTTATPRTG